MMDFVILVAAFVVAYMLSATVFMAVLFNKKAAKWYYKKVFKLMKVMDEAVDEFDEEEGA